MLRAAFCLHPLRYQSPRGKLQWRLDASPAFYFGISYLCLQGSLEVVSSRKVDVSWSGGTPQGTTLCHKCCNCTTMKQAERQQESAALLLLCSTYPNFYFIFSGFPHVIFFSLYCQTHSLMFFVYIVKFICIATWGQMWLQPGTSPTLHHKAHLGLNTKPTIHYNPTKHSKLHLLLPEQPNPSWHWHLSLAY